MRCEQARAWLVLAGYGELEDGERHELETHLRECAACAAERDELGRLRTLLTPPETAAGSARLREEEDWLLQQGRAELSAALEAEEPLPPPAMARREPVALPVPAARGFWRTVAEKAARPAVWVTLMAAGFAGGWWGHGLAPKPVLEPGQGMMAPGRPAAPSMQPAMTPALRVRAGEAVSPDALVRINSIERMPAGGIEIHYDTIEAHSMAGSSSAPGIRNLLLYAAEQPPNSGIRLDSLEVLGAQAEDRQVRQVLIHVLLHDANPGVRLKALESLQPWMGQDQKVRQAVMQAVLHDSSAGVRSVAVSVLSQAPRQEASALLRHAGNRTGDLYLRLRIAAALQQMQESVPAGWLRTSANPEVRSQ